MALAPPSPRKTALLVEDEPATLKFYTVGLKGLQEFALLSAENGVEALAKMEQQPVDVVVTDLNMPLLDGYGLIAILSQRYPSVPVIVITAVADPALHNQALELGALRVIAKPPKLSMLMEAIRAAASMAPPGMVRGLGLASILQLMNWEKRTATLTVRSRNGTGYLYVKDGELVHAAVGKESGLVAAYQLLTWEDLEVEFVYKCKVRSSIDLPLTEILMNLAVIRDTVRLPVKENPLRDEMWRG